METGIKVNVKVSKKVKECIYHNAYVEVCSDYGKADEIKSEEDFFKPDVEEHTWGTVTNDNEEDGGESVTFFIKEGFALDTLIQLVFMYKKYRECINALIPSTKAFLLKWFPKRYENYDNE